jgi:hypothetical protein
LNKICVSDSASPEVILEGILTTTTDGGQAHLAAMGPTVDERLTDRFDHMLLRPFRTTRTYANLARTGQAVFHVTDDVLLMARAAVGHLDPLPEVVPAEAVEGWILADCCRWFALQVESIDDAGPRAILRTKVVDQGRVREYFGLNRAKHAIVEAAILATRTHLVPAQEIRSELARTRVLVEKTGGATEREALDLLEKHLDQVAEGAR